MDKGMSAQEAWASVKPKWRFNKRKPTVKDVLGTPTVQQILAGETRTTDEPSGVMRTYLAQYDGKTGAPVWATPNCLADPIEKACHVRSDAKRTAALALEEYASDPKFPHADNYETEDEYIDALIEYMVPRTKLEPGPKATEAQLKAALCLHFMMSKVSETAHVDLLLANVAAIGARFIEADALTTTEFERDAAVMDEETTLVSVTAGSEKKKTRAWDTALTECNLAWDDSKALSDVLLERTKRDRDEDGKRVGFDDEEEDDYLSKVVSICDGRFIVLHHAGAEGKRIRTANARFDADVRKMDACNGLRYGFGRQTGRGGRKGAVSLPFGMDLLAVLCGEVQTHGALADCRTQERVWGMLIRGLYRHFVAVGEIRC